MTKTRQDDQYSDEETARRLRRVLEGAFAGPPTPLKDVPTRSGKRRKLGKRRSKKASGASPAAKAKTGRRRT
jgi:hypothetical protein